MVTVSQLTFHAYISYIYISRVYCKYALPLTSPLQWQRGVNISILWFEHIFISESLLIDSIRRFCHNFGNCTILAQIIGVFSVFTRSIYFLSLTSRHMYSTSTCIGQVLQSISIQNILHDADTYNYSIRPKYVCEITQVRLK